MRQPFSERCPVCDAARATLIVEFPELAYGRCSQCGLIYPDAAYWKIGVIPRYGRAFRPNERGWQHHVYFSEKNLIDACDRVGLKTQKLGKAVYRRRAGAPAIVEGLRFATLAAWVAASKGSRWRKELFHIVRKAVAAAHSALAA